MKEKQFPSWAQHQNMTMLKRTIALSASVNFQLPLELIHTADKVILMSIGGYTESSLQGSLQFGLGCGQHSSLFAFCCSICLLLLWGSHSSAAPQEPSFQKQLMFQFPVFPILAEIGLLFPPRNAIICWPTLPSQGSRSQSHQTLPPAEQQSLWEG